MKLKFQTVWGIQHLTYIYGLFGERYKRDVRRIARVYDGRVEMFDQIVAYDYFGALLAVGPGLDHAEVILFKGGVVENS